MITPTLEVIAEPAPAAEDAPVIFRPPNAWQTNNRTRHFIRLSERQYSHETDMDILRRSVEILLKQQDARGSFHTDEEYRMGDKVDDQLGGAAMLAYYLSVTDAGKGIDDALERAVRFHLDHLVNEPTPARPHRHIRYYIDRESGFDTTINVWALWGGALILRHGSCQLSADTLKELRDVMMEAWLLVSSDPQRDGNPCHNQRLAECAVGMLFANAIGNETIARQALDYYHKHLRRCGFTIAAT